MTRKDKMLNAFLANEELREKYAIPKDFRSNISEAKESEIPIVRTLALIIDGGEKSYFQVVNFLNEIKW